MEYDEKTISYTLDVIDILSGVHEILTTQHIADLLPMLKKLAQGFSDSNFHTDISAILCNLPV